VQRLELKTSVGTRVALGFVLLLVVLPLALLGKTIGIVISAALVAGFVALCIAMGKRRLYVDERGVTARGMSSQKQLAWDDVDHYTYWSMDQQAVYVHGGGGQAGVAGAIIVLVIFAIVRGLRKSKAQHRRFTQGRLVLVGKDGTQIPLDARYTDVALALDLAFAELHPRLRQRPLDFSPMTLTDTELRHTKKGVIGLADIEHISVGGQQLAIKKRDKRFSWASAPMRKVKNVMLFLEVLAERGLVVKASADVFMPAPVIDKLRIASSRQAAMPTARVVARD
jgi:hypothetical protein